MKFKLKTILDLIICLAITSLIFIPTLVRPWLLYDENLLFNGTYFPTPKNIGQMFEIISQLGLNFNIVSSNAIYSSNQVIRTAPLGQIFGMIISFFFKKDPVLFHTFNFSLHLINTCLVFFILNTLINKKNTIYQRILIISLTSIWSTHPVMIEPILLSINCGATFTYIFFFGMLLEFILNKDKDPSIKKFILIPILFMTAMLTNEYIVTLPLIIFIFAFYFNYQRGIVKDMESRDVARNVSTIIKSAKQSAPYFIGLFLYVIYYFGLSSFSTKTFNTSLSLLLERVLWLSPQIFFHEFLLVFYPKILSIDQSIFVKLGKTIFDPYSVFCFLFLTSFISFPLISFIFFKRFKTIFLTCLCFFISLLPFLHIIVPSYSLACERYLYTPLLFMVMGVGLVLKDLPGKHKSPQRDVVYKVSTVGILSIILILCMYRSHIRTLDWQDTYTFINVTYETSNNSFFKAVRLGMLGKAISVFNPEEKEKINKYFYDTLDLLVEARTETERNKFLYQDKLPGIVKAYGLDYESLIRKITFLEVASRCIELKESHKVGIELLKPYIEENTKVEPSIAELYAYLLMQDKNLKEAKEVLLRSERAFPNDILVLNKLFDISILENNYSKAEEYLKRELKLYSHDSSILLKALRFYSFMKNTELANRYYYLYKLRTGN